MNSFRRHAVLGSPEPFDRDESEADPEAYQLSGSRNHPVGSTTDAGDAGDVYGTVVWWAPHAFVESYQEMFESFLRGSVSDDTIPPVKQPIYRRIFIQLKGP